MLMETDLAHRKPAFSVSELSAVMASIAIVAAVAVPAVSRLGGHQRTTVCLNRIGMMTTAFLIYAQDYDGVFPFLATGHDYGFLNDTPDPIENWLVDCDWADPNDNSGQWSSALGTMQAIAYNRQEDWPEEPHVPRSGTLFPYALYEQIYRCPEFERISHPSKAHNVFNYTRAFWARRWLLPPEVDYGEELGDLQGPILRVADIHKPSDLPILLDEQWDRFVATDSYYGYGNGPYNCNDYLFGFENVLGVYHGGPVTSGLRNSQDGSLLDIHPAYVSFLWPQGGVGFYDGHAGLRRDPWPTFELGSGIEGRRRYDVWRGDGSGASGFDEIMAILQWMTDLIYAQRGFDAPARYGIVIPF